MANPEDKQGSHSVIEVGPVSAIELCNTSKSEAERDIFDEICMTACEEQKRVEARLAGGRLVFNRTIGLVPDILVSSDAGHSR